MIIHKWKTFRTGDGHLRRGRCSNFTSRSGHEPDLREIAKKNKTKTNKQTKQKKPPKSQNLQASSSIFNVKVHASINRKGWSKSGLFEEGRRVNQLNLRLHQNRPQTSGRTSYEHLKQKQKCLAIHSETNSTKTSY